MTTTTYFIHYNPNTSANYTNAINLWLNQKMSCIYLETHAWFAVTDMQAADIRDGLLSIIDSEDFLLVAAVGPDYSSWALNKKVTDWLRENWKPGWPTAR